MAGIRNDLKVRVDIAKNRLYCIVGGNITKADLDSFFTDVRFGVADLKPGFEVITDLTDCRFSHLAAIPTFRRVMHYLAVNGVREIVRVVNTKKLIYRQAINLAARVPGYSPVYVSTIKEAEDLLERPGGRAGLRFVLLQKEIFFGTDTASTKGELVNISISGCAIRTAGHCPAIGQKLTTKLSLTDQASIEKRFELEAEVVRLFDGGFAITFTKIEDADRDGLRECLVQESRVEAQVR